MARSKRGASAVPEFHPGDLVVVQHREWGRTVVHVHRVSWDARYVAGSIHESERGAVGTPIIMPRFGVHTAHGRVSTTGTLPLPAAARPRTAADMRDDILAAARTEFAEFGLAGARIDHIAQNSQVSIEVLYDLFSNKAALFQEVVAAARDEYFAALTVNPTAVADFVGDVFDLTQTHPHLLRMITWARLEGQPRPDSQLTSDAPTRHLVAGIEAAQADGHIDSSWVAPDLLVLLFGMALAWAQFPDTSSAWNDPATLAARRAAAVEAARRVLAPRR